MSPFQIKEQTLRNSESLPKVPEIHAGCEQVLHKCCNFQPNIPSSANSEGVSAPWRSNAETWVVQKILPLALPGGKDDGPTSFRDLRPLSYTRHPGVVAQWAHSTPNPNLRTPFSEVWETATGPYHLHLFRKDEGEYSFTMHLGFSSGQKTV